MSRSGIFTDSIHLRRKADHIEISLQKDIEFKEISTGLDDYSFIHQALPEIDYESVTCETVFLGKAIRAPLMISSMVGGIEEAERINRNLAVAAQSLGIAMGIGSQRCALDDESAAGSYRVRDVAPDIFLCANIGAVQLNCGYGTEECIRAVEMIGADALILHLNPLQEALQGEGNTGFSLLSEKIGMVCRELPVPVIVKEVSFGISERTASMLADAGVSAIDVAGAGGTSWSEVEKYRSLSAEGYNIASSFSSWGIPTADSIIMAKKAAPRLSIIASGGIRTGIDAAKAMALGADLSGVALPLLKAASKSADAAISACNEIITGLRIAMFCIGAESLEKLKNTPHIKQTKRS